MPVIYEIFPEENHMFVRYDGRITNGEIADSFVEAQGNPDFRLDLAHLVDLTTADFSVLDFQKIFSLFNMYARAHEGAGVKMRVSIFAPSDTVFGMSRMFENLAGTSDFFEVRIFDNLKAAREWAIHPEDCNNDDEELVRSS